MSSLFLLYWLSLSYKENSCFYVLTLQPPTVLKLLTVSKRGSVGSFAFSRYKIISSVNSDGLLSFLQHLCFIPLPTWCLNRNYMVPDGILILYPTSKGNILFFFFFTIFYHFYLGVAVWYFNLPARIFNKYLPVLDLVAHRKHTQRSCWSKF